MNIADLFQSEACSKKDCGGFDAHAVRYAEQELGLAVIQAASFSQARIDVAAVCFYYRHIPPARNHPRSLIKVWIPVKPDPAG